MNKSNGQTGARAVFLGLRQILVSGFGLLSNRGALSFSEALAV